MSSYLLNIHSTVLFQRKSSEEENEIDKQEREIIESLEREEKEHKKYLESISSGMHRLK